MKLSATMEDYLEAIALLIKKNRRARVSDISAYMDVKKSSVNAALQTLQREGLVLHERYGNVDLTKKGKGIAANVQRRHNLLVTFLTKVLSIDHSIAMNDACKIEHEMSELTVKRLGLFIKHFEEGQEMPMCSWLKRFKQHIVKNGSEKKTKVGKKK